MNNIISFCAQYVFIFVVVGIGLAWARTTRNRKLEFVVATVLAGSIAFILAKIASKLYYDPRPFVTEHVRPLVSHAADNGFPSDHALFTMAITAITYFYSKKIATGMFVLTVVVGAARVLAKVHSSLDIGAGWLFGVVGAVAGYYIATWVFSQYARWCNSRKSDSKTAL